MNVILITIDCLRADHLGSSGYVKKLTTNLDEFAEKGVLFSHAFSYGPNTPTSVPPMLTSSPFLPYYYAFYETKNAPMKLHEGLERYKKLITSLFKYKSTIAGALREHGYQTATFHSNPLLSRYYGFGAGFSYFDDSFSTSGIRKYSEMREKIKVILSSSKRLTNLAGRVYYLIYRNEVPYERAEAINKKAISWLRSKENEKFFLWLHYMDTHVPYKPIKDFRPPISSVKMSALNRKILNDENISEGEMNQIIELYDGSIKYVDHAIKHLLDELDAMKILEDTIVVITADHGEEFKDHGNLYHTPTKLYDELIHVPLIIYNSEFHGTVIDEPVSLIDIAPTIMSMLDLPNVKTFQGRSLIPIIKGKKSYGIISQGMGSQGLDDNLKMIVAYRTKRWKYILDTVRNRKELYDMKRDPKETKNLYEVERDVAKELESRTMELISYQQKMVAMDMEKERVRGRIKKLREAGKASQTW